LVVSAINPRVGLSGAADTGFQMTGDKGKQMQEESVVYGCIKDSVYAQDVAARMEVNRTALEALPSIEHWPLLSREMFATTQHATDINLHTEIVHFGASYHGIEYEWHLWLQQFEALLRKMYWVSVSVQLETEMSGTHSFTWHTSGEYHEPGSSDIQLRCEWIHDL